MMKKATTMRNSNNRVNYEKLVDLLNNSISTMKTKNYSIDKILNEIHKVILEKISLRPGDIQNHISRNMIRYYDNIATDKVTPMQILILVERLLEYRTDTSYRKQICNVFTIIEYWKNPKKYDSFKQNWTDIMKKTK